MLEINIPAVLATAAVMFVIGAVWNGIFGSILLKARGGDAAAVSGAMPLGRMLAEMIRVIVVATVAATVLRLAGVTDVWDAFRLGLLVWVGFQAALLSGAVIWEGMPLHVYAIHAGDALLKMAAISIILGLWQ